VTDPSGDVTDRNSFQALPVLLASPVDFDGPDAPGHGG
jgi:hypothetical protein